MQETQSLVTIIPWTFIAQILNLFIQMYLIKRFLFKPINEVLEKRRQLADQEIREAQATQIVQDAQKTAQIRAEEVVKEAQDHAAAIKAQAQADIEQEKKKAVNEAKNQIGGLAMDIAGKVVEKEIREEDHRKLIDEFIENVGDAS